MSSGLWDIPENAREAREAGKPIDAADWFTVQAYSYLADQPFRDRPLQVFRLAKSLSRAAICYRLGDRPEIARSRAEHGALVIDESFDRLPEYYDPPLLNLHRATLLEHLGDLRGCSEQSEDPGAYQQAIEQYEAAADATSREAYYLIDTEYQSEYSIALFNELVRVTDASVEKVHAFDDELTFSQWVEHKQRHFPDLVDELLERGIEAYQE